MTQRSVSASARTVAIRFTASRDFVARRCGPLLASILLDTLLMGGLLAGMQHRPKVSDGRPPALVTVAFRPEQRAPAPKPEMAGPLPNNPARASPAALHTPGPLAVRIARPVSESTHAAGKRAAHPTGSADPVPMIVPAISSAPSQTLPPDRTAAEVDLYRQQVWRRIADARPQNAKGSGKVTVRFAIDREGDLVSVRILNTSGQFFIDRAALRAVRQAAPFPAPPPQMDDAALTFIVPLDFHD